MKEGGEKKGSERQEDQCILQLPEVKMHFLGNVAKQKKLSHIAEYIYPGDRHPTTVKQAP